MLGKLKEHLDDAMISDIARTWTRQKRKNIVHFHERCTVAHATNTTVQTWVAKIHPLVIPIPLNTFRNAITFVCICAIMYLRNSHHSIPAKNLSKLKWMKITNVGHRILIFPFMPTIYHISLAFEAKNLHYCERHRTMAYAVQVWRKY